jgi:2-(1,2-epoxy-1,2-dihydrophenyl)acetyl-CoA isomerase
VPDVVYEKDASGVATVTLNRPDALNTLGGTILQDFGDAVREATNDPAVRVLAITGAGRAFSAGAQLSASRPEPAAEGARSRSHLEAVQSMERLHANWAGAVYACPKPTVALINGPCAGAGFGMALSSDFRIASETAIFVSAFARIALAGDNGVTYGLSRLVGRARALEILMLNPRLTAAEALELGLVRQVVPADQLIPVGMELCEKLAAGPTGVYALMKANLAFAEVSTYEESLKQESSGIAIAQVGPERQGAVEAFLEKRDPDFRL